MGNQTENELTQSKKLSDYYHILKDGLYKHDGFFPLLESPSKTNELIGDILLDSPDLFWFEGKWRIDANERIIPLYTMSISQVEEAKVQMNKVISSLDYLKVENDKTMVAKEIYRWLVDNVKYDSEKKKGQTSYDALVKKSAVCKGLAKAYQLLLREHGIVSFLLWGTIDGRTKHVWNTVDINGTLNEVDVCMGYKEFNRLFPDGLADALYRGFCMPHALIVQTHHIER